MNTYEKSLNINDSVFDKMRDDADKVLQKLFKNMVEKDSLEGKVNITIDVTLHSEYIPNNDPYINGETRKILTPKISHKVGSVLQIKNECKGDTSLDGMEMVLDENGEYVLKPVANTDQMSIFDVDFQTVNSEEVSNVPLLENNDAEDDISDEFTGMNKPIDDDYGYEEP